MLLRARLLADAEPGEDPVEQVVGVDRTDHLAQLLQRPAQLGGQQLRRVLLQRRPVRLPQVAQGAPAGTSYPRQASFRVESRVCRCGTATDGPEGRRWSSTDSFSCLQTR